MKVMVETSAHHVHVTKETLEALFGKGATLTNKKNLSQPGQFACVEKVTVVGPKSEMKMSILGPERSADRLKSLLRTLVSSALPLLSENQAILQAHQAASLSVPRAKLKSNAV